jgi:DNA gyrase inhibitor GyrI
MNQDIRLLVAKINHAAQKDTDVYNKLKKLIRYAENKGLLDDVKFGEDCFITKPDLIDEELVEEFHEHKIFFDLKPKN